MKPLRKLVRELFGYDRRERRATFILSVLVMILIVVRFASGARVRQTEAEVKTEAEAEVEVEEDGADKGKRDEVKMFSFDPNKASFEDLVELGLSEHQSKTLINYRSSGAVFRLPEDIRKVYGIDSLTAARLIPWVIIEKGESPNNDASAPRHEYASVYEKPPPDEAITEAIDINACDSSDLVSLPGIGPVLSVRIIRYRRLLGGFVREEQLKEVYGIDSVTYDLIRGKVKISIDSVKFFELDSCTFAEMAGHPYFGPDVARALIKYRTLMKKPVYIDDLVEQRVISGYQAERIRPYVRQE